MMTKSKIICYILFIFILTLSNRPGRSESIGIFHGNQMPMTSGPALFLAPSYTDLYVDDDFTPAIPGWGTTHFATIGSALSVAVSDDIIHIYTGTYPEQVVVSLPVTLQAGTGENPVMNGYGLRSGTGITVSAPGVIIQGITIQDYDYGILITSTGSAVVDQCKIFDNLLYGILNQNTSVVSDATDCWWGASSGPYDPSDDRGTGGLYNPNGLGDNASDYISYYPWSVNTTFTQQPVEFGIYNTGCETLEVRLKPLTDISSNTTIIQFAVRWLTGSVSLTNALSPVYGLALDYTVTGISGYDYAVFTSDAFTAVNWTAGVEVPVMTVDHDGTGTGFGEFEIVMDSWTLANNADPYLELMGTDYSGFTYHKAENVYLDDCDNPELQVRVLLEGAYDSLTNLMRTDINPGIPLNQPYYYPPWSYTGPENLSAVPSDMADWVLVELRNTPTGPAVDRTAGILREDGMILDAGLDGYIRFDGITAASPYYVVVYHRHHLPVMSNDPVMVPNLALHDFSDTLNFPPFGTGKKALSRLETGVYGLINGDVNNDGRLKYSGPQNDRGLIMNRIYYETGSPVITQTIEGYYQEDLTMDYTVKYSGPGNDQREIILNLVELTGSTSLTSVFECVVPGYVSSRAFPGGMQTDFSGELADIGIFEYSEPDELVIMIRPDHDIPGYGLTNIQFTISWAEGSSVNLVWPTANVINSTFIIQPQGPVTLANGYYHQVFAAASGNPITWSAGIEYPVLVVKYFYTTPDCTEFEISADAWTLANNGVYYFEVIGQDRTGILYEPIVQIVSEGGYVDGGQEICLGTSTGTMLLMNYSGTVTKWQRSHNSGAWTDIAGTAGLTNYSEVPPAEGTWEYRAEVQKFGCAPDLSDPAVFSVVGKVIWTGNTDSDWDDAGNWNACGIPTITTDVIIPDVSPNPFPYVTVDGYCKTIEIETGAQVWIALTGSVTVGNLVLDGATHTNPIIQIINEKQ